MSEISSVFLPAVPATPSVATAAKNIIPEIFGFGTSAIGTLASWQLQAEWILSIAAAGVALVSGLLTIRSLLRKEKKRSIGE